jgi:hypothetical protein
MSIELVRYFINSMSVGGSQLYGVSTVSIERAANPTTLIKKGLPSTTRNWYKKPSASISYSRFLTSTIFTPINTSLMSQGGGRPTVTTIKVGTIGGGIFQFNDARLKSLNFNFPNEGNFTESVTYEGTTLSSGANGLVELNDVSDSIRVLRRKNFNMAGSTMPSAVANGVHLLSVEASLSINYGNIPTWGDFYTNKSSYISFPMDISCTFEILDTGFGSSVSDFFTDSLSNNAFESNLQDEEIVISSGGPTINLGTKNYLSNIERSGGDAGQNNYAIYKVTYKNTNNYFTVS